MPDMTGIVKRTDYAPYSGDMQRVCLFCSHCDPEGKGGNGGIIYTAGFDFDHAVENAQKTQHFCPTCGRSINYDNIKERDYWADK